MLKSNRLEEIKRILEEKSEVQTVELSKRFKVSEMTIRRDIDELSQNAAIIRTRGGAYLAPASQQKEPSYTSRLRVASDVKEKLSIKAAELMDNYLTVYLDSGTTTECILKHINASKRHVIITNGINIAQESVNYSHLSTFLIGGEFRTNSLSTIGPSAEEMLRRFRFEVAFLGANAIDIEGNAYVGATLEVGLKKCVIENSMKCYILADSSKFNTFSLMSYINIGEIEGVITDRGLAPEIYEQLIANKVNVIFAD